MLFSLEQGDTAPPRRMTAGSAGYDLTVDADVVIPAGATRIVSTGVAMAIPDGHVGEVHIRSSLGIKHGLVLANQTGIIDADFRGFIQLGLRNTSNKQVSLPRGHRTAQLVVHKIEMPPIMQVDTLPETQRGASGIGSTGAA